MPAGKFCEILNFFFFFLFYDLRCCKEADFLLCLSAIVPEKRLRFVTTTDASEVQVIEAMQKIASHIKNLSKVGKASKLAIQLIQAGSVKPGTSNHFFSILESAMSSPTVCNDPSVRADYHALFLAAQDAIEVIIYFYIRVPGTTIMCYSFALGGQLVLRAISNLYLTTICL